MPFRDWRKIIGAGALAVLVAACASTEAYEEVLQGWVGKHTDELVEAWGPPQSNYEFRDGRRVLQYVEVRTRYLPPTTSYSHRTGNREILFDGYFSQYSCITTFEAAVDGFIRSWKWEGNGCAIVPE